VPPRDRARLERLCRYALRLPIAQERLHRTPEGQVILDLRHRWADGTTYLVFEPLELLERLASLAPRPPINLLLYYGVLGARFERAVARRSIRQHRSDLAERLALRHDLNRAHRRSKDCGATLQNCSSSAQQGQRLTLRILRRKVA